MLQRVRLSPPGILDAGLIDVPHANSTAEAELPFARLQGLVYTSGSDSQPQPTHRCGGDADRWLSRPSA